MPVCVSVLVCGLAEKSVCVCWIEKGREEQTEKNERIDLERETGMEGEIERYLTKGGWG